MIEVCGCQLHGEERQLEQLFKLPLGELLLSVIHEASLPINLCIEYNPIRKAKDILPLGNPNPSTVSLSKAFTFPLGSTSTKTLTIAPGQ
jgi:hypothetical protein